MTTQKSNEVVLCKKAKQYPLERVQTVAVLEEKMQSKRHLSFHQMLASHKDGPNHSGHAAQSRTTFYNHAR